MVLAVNCLWWRGREATAWCMSMAPLHHLSIMGGLRLVLGAGLVQGMVSSREATTGGRHEGGAGVVVSIS